MMHRRDFLKGAAALGALSFLPFPAGAAQKSSAHMLVLIHLFGGNDGLNTVIPCEDAAYRKLRPSLALPAKDCLKLGSGLWLHPALKPLHELWERGTLAIANGVGYPEPNHSHFHSSDVWHTAGRSGSQGWLGRAGWERAVSADPVISRAFWGREERVLSRVREVGLQTGVRQGLDRLYADQEGCLAAAHRALLEAESVRCEGETCDLGDFGENLATLLAFMPKAQVYHCSMSGFDTHVDQPRRHAEKLAEFARGLAWFWQRVQKRGLASRTTVMVYSEFGRRAEENASGGTDHGTAGPVFLLGAHVSGGFKGEFPSLSSLHEGDLVHTVDFRSIYAGLLEKCLGQAAEPILGSKFSALPL